MRLFLAFCFSVCLLPALACGQSTDSLRISYIGNMGVLIQGKTSSVLIDGLHSFYKPAYLPPPPSLVNRLIANESDSFPPIRLVLNTHIHGDHFDPKLVSRFLRQNPDARFMGSTQAQAQLEELGGDAKGQLHGVSMDSYDRHSMIHYGIPITGFYMNHGYAVRHSAIENIGFLVALDGKRILHVGDTEWYEEVFQVLGLYEDEIDIAILPYWMLMGEKAKELVEKWIHPDHIIGTHIPPTDYEETCEKIRKQFPEAVLFTEIGQGRSYR